MQRLLSLGEDPQAHRLASSDYPQVTDADLDLGPACPAAGPLPDEDHDLFAVFKELLRLDLELLEDLQLRVDQPFDVLATAVRPGEDRAIGNPPFELRINELKAALKVAAVDRLIEPFDQLDFLSEASGVTGGPGCLREPRVFAARTPGRSAVTSPRVRRNPLRAPTAAPPVSPSSAVGRS
jgi:hypothetical protein